MTIAARLPGLHAPAGGSRMQAAVPNPPPTAPPGLADFVSQILGYGKWIIVSLAVLCVLLCAAMIIAGRRQRSATAYSGLEGIAWIIAGVGVAGFGPLILLAFRL
jgi:hypothetical protein